MIGWSCTMHEFHKIQWVERIYLNLTVQEDKRRAFGPIYSMNNLCKSVSSSCWLLTYSFLIQKQKFENPQELHADHASLY